MSQESRRWMLFLMIAMAVLVGNAFFMEKAQKKKAAENAQQTTEQTATPNQTTAPALPDSESTASPSQPNPTQPAAPTPEPVIAEKGEMVEVETESFHIRLNTAGAVPVAWQVIDERFALAAEIDVEEARKAGNTELNVGDFLPVQIIPEYEDIDPNRDYPLMVVLKEADGRFYDSLNRRVYELERSRDADGTQILRFTSPVTREGIRLVKTYRFPAKGFLTEVSLRIEHTGGEGAQKVAFNEPTRPGLGLTWGPGIGKAHYNDRWDARFFKVAAYEGEEIASEKLSSWEDAAEGKPVVETFLNNIHWIALDSRFYMATVIPQSAAPMARSVVKRQHIPRSEREWKDLTPPASVEVYTGGLILSPGDSQTTNYTLYVGPKKRQLLAEIDATHEFGLHKIMFHSSMWLIRVLSVFMLHLLTWFHQLTGNYGVAIILLVLVMRLITQPLTHIGMKSQARVMAEQKQIKPLIDAINEKYKDDPQKRNQEIWKTYREHGVNPFGMLKGCIWMLVQLPIFFALYWLLMSAIDLRGAPFLWIDDLTAPDALFTLPFSLPLLGNKFNLIPILMGISQVFAQRLQSANIEDPTQKQMAMIMPIVFVAIFYNFAAGLSLYWFVSNLWQISFQIFVNRKVREEAEQKATRAFDARQRKTETIVVPSRKKQGSAGAKKSWRERIVAMVEEKAREAEKKRDK